MLAGQRLTASVFIVGIVAAPVTTSANGTATVGTTETFDTAGLGYYPVTLIAGHRYQAVLNGLVGNGSVVGDTFMINIRDSGSASNPTSASTLIAQSDWEVPVVGSGGRVTIPDALTFLAATGGTHTFGVSAVRSAGTGVFTPIGTRELYIMDMGGN